MRQLRLARFTLIFLTATLALIPLQWLLLRMQHRLASRVPLYYHRFLAWLIGVRVIVAGEPVSERPLMILSNHVSWLDIVVLSTVLPVSFVAKSDVAGWPLFGTLARLQRTIFVDRQRRSSAGVSTREIAARLADGEAIVLFAEGTTSDGNRILPFRSTLVGAAREAVATAGTDARAITVQPVTIAYQSRNGIPLDRRTRADIAWYGDMELTPHLAGVVTRGPIDVVIAFNDPIPFDGATDRKQVTRQAEARVRERFYALHRDTQATVKTVLSEAETG
jgi:1-acyl-sn-glycerol-3-phosphate acyltransferase